MVARNVGQRFPSLSAAQQPRPSKLLQQKYVGAGGETRRCHHPSCCCCHRSVVVCYYYYCWAFVFAFAGSLEGRDKVGPQASFAELGLAELYRRLPRGGATCASNESTKVHMNGSCGDGGESGKEETMNWVI